MDARKLQDLRNHGIHGEEAADEIDRLTRELAEAARAPLAEENARLLARIVELEQSVKTFQIARDGYREENFRLSADKRALLQGSQEQASEITRLRADLAAKAGEVEALKSALAAERADAVIEWEPGRSYTAAELLRRAIRGLRVRKGRPVWPAVMNLCGVGSNVGHHLCLWAGRDPETGQEIAARKGEGVAGA